MVIILVASLGIFDGLFASSDTRHEDPDLSCCNRPILPVHDIHQACFLGRNDQKDDTTRYPVVQCGACTQVNNIHVK